MPADVRVSSRAGAVDWLRGLVMALMTIDHVREFFATNPLPDPMDVSGTPPSLFFTRWITHLCAPSFLFLSGVSAYLSSQRQGDPRGYPWVLLRRGIWLIVLELTVVAYSWSFSFAYPRKFLSVLWAIGVSTIVLGALVRLPHAAIGVIGAVIVAGHDLLNGIRVAPGSPWHVPWALLHQRDTFPLGDFQVRVSYPVLPWIGVMALGYWLGPMFALGADRQARRSWLRRSGVACLASFAVLRTAAVYGDPHPFATRSTALQTAMAFVNTSKYGPSLLFLLMTLGPAFLLLRASERWDGGVSRALRTLGQTPLVYYVLHWYWIHLLALAPALFVRGDSWASIDFARKFAGLDRPLNVPLYGVYLIAAYVVASLYPVCEAYPRWKRAVMSRLGAWSSWTLPGWTTQERRQP